MTDPTGLPPEQEAVRRLLADARHDGATPPEVVARLDDALASLRAEMVAGQRDATPAIAPVVDLGARRRRLAGVGLLAAAAVVVAGVAIGQALPRMQGGSDAGSSADSATSEREFGSQEDSAGSDAGGGDGQELAPQSRKSGTPAPLASYPTLASGDADLDQELLDLRSSAYDAAQAPDPSASAEALNGCDARGTGRGRRLLAEVDGQVGVVVFRRADGASQQVDLYVCGDPQAVRTLTLPAP
jgi:hypothetical protein